MEHAGTNRPKPKEKSESGGVAMLPTVLVPERSPLVTAEVAAVLLRVLLRRGEALGLLSHL